MMYVGEVETREVNGRTYTVKMVEDDDPFLDWMGEYTSDPGGKDWIVDRRQGRLYGPESLNPEPLEEDFETDDEDWEDGIEWNKYDDAYAEWEENGQHYAEDLSRMEYNQYRYWEWAAESTSKVGSYGKPGECQHYREYIKPKMSRYGIVDVREDTPAENKRVTESVYACQDYERMNSYGKHWWMVGIVVATLADACPECGNRDEVSASLWGIESDAGDEYHEEIVKELIAECEEQLA